MRCETYCCCRSAYLHSQVKVKHLRGWREGGERHGRVTSLVASWVTVANVGGGAPGAKHPHGAGHQAGPHTAAPTNLILNI